SGANDLNISTGNTNVDYSSVWPNNIIDKNILTTSEKTKTYDIQKSIIFSAERNEINYVDMDKMYIAIIGDGGLTGGMALEALNYISFLKSNVLIIYNDNGQVSLPTNGISISGNKPIGSISDHLHDYIQKKKQKNNDSSYPDKQNNIFENLNYNYIKIENGNNIQSLFNILNNIKKNKINKPTILHILTKKANDYINMVSPINVMHSIKKNEILNFDFDAIFGKYDNVTTSVYNRDEEKQNICKETPEYIEKELFINLKKKISDLDKNKVENVEPIQYDKMFTKKTFTDIYTEEMLKHLEKNNNTIFISPAMLGGSGLLKISKKYKNNIYDVGIAEQHSVTFATAMAMNEKLKIHLHIYSTFLQRAYDQIIHDTNLQNVPLNIIIHRSGLIGEDGATHQGIYDLSYLGILNNSIVISPSNHIDLKKALNYCQLKR
ncbi:1-deoxy-D-xylulose 5-phosphate synthase, putative, partial [Hepatocystis sp. ex Piliocolobus tephrosceles]